MPTLKEQMAERKRLRKAGLIKPDSPSKSQSRSRTKPISTPLDDELLDNIRQRHNQYLKSQIGAVRPPIPPGWHEIGYLLRKLEEKDNGR